MSFAMALAMTMASCSDDDNKVEIQETDAAYVGKEVGNFTADEWYPGGKLGTTENTGSSSYSDQTPAVDNDSCNISQPTLSAMLLKLEEELDVRIFDRTNKQVTPTSAGEKIILQAKRHFWS